jgi:predicted PurR-regulated permease PerM
LVEESGTKSRRDAQRIALGVLTGLTFVVVAWMAAPLLAGLALGTVMAFTAQPLQERLTARLRRRAVSSAITTLLGGLLVAGGGAAALFAFAREVVAVVGMVQREIAGGQSLGPSATRFLSFFGLQRDVVLARLRDELGRAANLAAEGAGVVLQASAGVMLTVVLAMWTMYYVLLDWPRIAPHLERLLPLDPEHTRALVGEFREVGRSAFVGTVASAMAQGVLAGLGFAIFGVPQAVTWAAILALSSFIPVIGTLLVWVPAAGWLASAGHPVRGILLAAWSLILVMAGNDYFIRPRLIGRSGSSHPLLTLVALLGGITVFGVAGVIVGPVIMSLFVASARIYERERSAALDAARSRSGAPPR